MTLPHEKQCFSSGALTGRAPFVDGTVLSIISGVSGQSNVDDGRMRTGLKKPPGEQVEDVPQCRIEEVIEYQQDDYRDAGGNAAANKRQRDEIPLAFGQASSSQRLSLNASGMGVGWSR